MFHSCFHIFEEFLQIATQQKPFARRADESSHQNPKRNDVLLNANYQLPSDYNKLHEDPTYATLDTLIERMEDPEVSNRLLKNSYINSLLLYDKQTKEHKCPAPQPQATVAPKRVYKSEYYRPYSHYESEENISAWNV